MNKLLSGLAQYLREQRDRIVTKRSVLTECYDPTYGLQDPRSEDIEVVDFDALCEAIDEFSALFEHPVSGWKP